MLAWMRLARVFQKVDRAASEQLRRWNLSMAQFDILAQAGSAANLTQQELADHLLVTKGNITQLLDRMERSGLILRRPDGRTNRICLTQAGKQLFDAVVPIHEDFIAAQLAPLSSQEQIQLLGLLHKLDHALTG